MALAVLVLSSAWGVWGVYRKDLEAQGLKTDAQNQLADLMARQTKLQSDLAQLQTHRGMEAVLRNSYNVGHPGEGMIFIVEPQTSPSTSTASSGWNWIHQIFPW